MWPLTCTRCADPVMNKRTQTQRPALFGTSLGVWRKEGTSVRELEGVLERRQDEIEAIPGEYGVPQMRRARRSASR
jgi:hypothetical protein